MQKVFIGRGYQVYQSDIKPFPAKYEFLLHHITCLKSEAYFTHNLKRVICRDGYFLLFVGNRTRAELAIPLLCPELVVEALVRPLRYYVSNLLQLSNGTEEVVYHPPRLSWLVEESALSYYYDKQEVIEDRDYVVPTQHFDNMYRRFVLPIGCYAFEDRCQISPPKHHELQRKIKANLRSVKKGKKVPPMVTINGTLTFNESGYHLNHISGVVDNFQAGCEDSMAEFLCRADPLRKWIYNDENLLPPIWIGISFLSKGEVEFYFDIDKEDHLVDKKVRSLRTGAILC